MGLCLFHELVEDDTFKIFITIDVRAIKQEGFHFPFFLNRTYYRGIPSKGYNVFFQRPHEQLTENNRKLGRAQFQKSSSDIVRTKCCCLAQSSLISEL